MRRRPAIAADWSYTRLATPSGNRSRNPRPTGRKPPQLRAVTVDELGNSSYCTIREYLLWFGAVETWFRATEGSPMARGSVGCWVLAITVALITSPAAWPCPGL